MNISVVLVFLFSVSGVFYFIAVFSADTYAFCQQYWCIYRFISGEQLYSEYAIFDVLIPRVIDLHRYKEDHTNVDHFVVSRTFLFLYIM